MAGSRTFGVAAWNLDPRGQSVCFPSGVDIFVQCGGRHFIGLVGRPRNLIPLFIIVAASGAAVVLHVTAAGVCPHPPNSFIIRSESVFSGVGHIVLYVWSAD